MPIAIRLDAAGSLVNAAQGAGGFATGQALQEMGLRQDQFNLQAQGQAQNYGLAQQRLAFEQQHQQDTTDLGYATLDANDRYRYDALGSKYDLEGMREDSQQERDHLLAMDRQGLLDDRGKQRLAEIAARTQAAGERLGARLADNKDAREWRTGENDKSRNFRADQNDLNRTGHRSDLEYTADRRAEAQKDGQEFRAGQSGQQAAARQARDVERRQIQADYRASSAQLRNLLQQRTQANQRLRAASMFSQPYYQRQVQALSDEIDRVVQRMQGHEQRSAQLDEADQGAPGAPSGSFEFQVPFAGGAGDGADPAAADPTGGAGPGGAVPFAATLPAPAGVSPPAPPSSAVPPDPALDDTGTHPAPGPVRPMYSMADTLTQQQLDDVRSRAWPTGIDQNSPDFMTSWWAREKEILGWGQDSVKNWLQRVYGGQYERGPDGNWRKVATVSRSGLPPGAGARGDPGAAGDQGPAGDPGAGGGNGGGDVLASVAAEVAAAYPTLPRELKKAMIRQRLAARGVVDPSALA